MLNSGNKFRALPDKKNKYSNSCVVRKKFLNETKNHNPPFKLNGRYLTYLQEEFEDNKGMMRIRKSKKNRQHNGTQRKSTNNDLQNIHIKLEIE